jgi:hypothetical protein
MLSVYVLNAVAPYSLYAFLRENYLKGKRLSTVDLLAKLPHFA